MDSRSTSISVPKPSADSDQASSRAAHAASWVFSARITAFCCFSRAGWASPTSPSRVSIVEDTTSPSRFSRATLVVHSTAQSQKSRGVIRYAVLFKTACTGGALKLDFRGRLVGGEAHGLQHRGWLWKGW